MTRRGEKTAVAYGTEHQKLRRDLAPIVASGTVTCWRCGDLIQPGQPWDLGHDDHRTMIMGPEHRACNRRAGSNKITNGWRRRPKRLTYGPRPNW